MRTIRSFPLLAALVTAVIAASPALAYDYGYGGLGGSEEEGFFVFLDAVLTQPSNLDQVVGETIDQAGSVQTSTVVQPSWDAGASGRIGFGYRWATGGKVSMTYWGYEDDARLAVDGPSGGFLNFAIGPATYVGGYPLFNFGIPGRAEFEGTVEASTIDVAFSQEQELSDILSMEWSVGLRFATFEDGVTGTYDLCASVGCDGTYGYLPGDITLRAERTTESTMAGLRGGVRGRYTISERFGVRAGLALSVLTGEVESRSGLTPTGRFNASLDPQTRFVAEDSDRTGRIVDFDVAFEIDAIVDRLRFWLGYEHSTWDGIAADLARNPPGLLVVNPARDEVAFSGPKLGVWVRF